MCNRELAYKVYAVLHGANVRNCGRPCFVPIDEIASTINKELPDQYTTGKEVISSIENDPFRQKDMHGEKTGIRLFEYKLVNGIMTHAILPKHAFENLSQWDLFDN
ncbi:hypothetical protein [Pectobacterium sp. B1J-3]|uniref:hypothetical protein n=1 Tax=Pectobacterium sp. B1J-3 TaxID=3385371 RepID=UPI0039069878